LEWWTKNLSEILDKFIKAYEGEIDNSFWKYIFKYYEGSSGENDHINGWILNLIPYID